METVGCPLRTLGLAGYLQGPHGTCSVGKGSCAAGRQPQVGVKVQAGGVQAAGGPGRVCLQVSEAPGRQGWHPWLTQDPPAEGGPGPISLAEDPLLDISGEAPRAWH